jgi:hyaluronan synthase
MWEGWLWRQPVITSVSVIQNLLGPFTLTVAAYFFIVELAAHRWGLAALVWSWLLLGRAIKGIGHVFSEPEALLFLPLITLVFIVVMIPVKIYALCTLNKQGWITRRGDGGVAEGQANRTLGLIGPLAQPE